MAKTNMRPHKCRRSAVVQQRQKSGAIGGNQCAATQIQWVWSIVNSRPLGRARQTVEHCTLRTGHCKPRTATVSADPLGTKAWQIYMPPFGIQSQVKLFPTLTPWDICTSQTLRPPIQLWKISWYSWASGGFGCCGYGVSWLQKL